MYTLSTTSIARTTMRRACSPTQEACQAHSFVGSPQPAQAPSARQAHLAPLALWLTRLIWVNVAVALGMNLGVIVAAATVGIPLWLSVAMDNLGLMVVLANSMWPLVWKVAPGDSHYLGEPEDGGRP